jgi:hypothetical protein
MTSADRSNARGGMPALYEIRVRGDFDQKWSNVAGGTTLQVVDSEAQRVTVIRVVVQDQVALAGLLDALFGLNAMVLSVTALEAA